MIILGDDMKRLIVLLTCLTLPVSVGALTKEERLAKLNELPIIEENGEKYLNTKIVDPSAKLAKECTFTEEDYKKADSKDPGYFEKQGITSESWIKSETYSCKDRIMTETLSVFLKSLGYKIEGNNNLYLINDFTFTDDIAVRISYSDETENTPLENPIKIKFIKDSENYSEAKAKLNAFESEYSMFGLNVINSVYHYGLTNDDAYLNDALIARYGNVKDIFESEKEYKFVNYNLGGGGAPYYATFINSIGVMKDGILYDTKEILFKEYNIVYVDKNETGTVFEKAERRLKDNFKNEIEVQVDGSETWELDGEEINEIISKNLGTKDVHYVGHYARTKIGKTETDITIVEIPKDKLDNYNVSSKDTTSGVMVSTNSYEVPLDAKVSAKNVTNDEYVKKASEENNLKIDSAYDITLSKMFDSKLITQIKNGIEVLLPVGDSYEENQTVEIYYISEDGKTNETIKGNVIIKDGKKYAKFKTTHFSTYALASNSAEETDPIIKVINPATGDNIIKYVILSLVSLGIITLAFVLKKKVNK